MNLLWNIYHSTVYTDHMTNLTRTMTTMAPTLQPSSSTMTTMSQAQWTYICVLARSTDQIARRQKNRFESEPSKETWSERDDFIWTQMYNNEYLYRLVVDDEHDVLVPPIHVTSDTRSRINDVFLNFMEVYRERRTPRGTMNTSETTMTSMTENS